MLETRVMRPPSLRSTKFLVRLAQLAPISLIPLWFLRGTRGRVRIADALCGRRAELGVHATRSWAWVLARRVREPAESGHLVKALGRVGHLACPELEAAIATVRARWKAIKRVRVLSRRASELIVRRRRRKADRVSVP